MIVGLREEAQFAPGGATGFESGHSNGVPGLDTQVRTNFPSSGTDQTWNPFLFKDVDSRSGNKRRYQLNNLCRTQMDRRLQKTSSPGNLRLKLTTPFGMRSDYPARAAGVTVNHEAAHREDAPPDSS